MWFKFSTRLKRLSLVVAAIVCSALPASAEPVGLIDTSGQQLVAMGGEVAMISLGTFASGTVLTFRLDVSGIGYGFFTAPASGNPDNLIHAGYTLFAADGTIP